MTKIPRSHPRYASLVIRDKIVDGVEKGITSIHGLIAQGRGEAFDYLIGERTNKFAKDAIKAAAAMLLLAKMPVISVNGNAAVLVPKEIAELSKVLNCPIEINIFHSSKRRELKIKSHLLKNGAKKVLMPGNAKLRYLDSNRKYVNKDGIFKADVVFVPLEDGDRCEALQKVGKKVITVDLNPMSRTARKADVTIVDNIVRCLSLLINQIKSINKKEVDYIRKILYNYNNKKILDSCFNKLK